MNIYRIHASDKYPPLVLVESGHWGFLDLKIGRSQFGIEWQELHFMFDQTRQTLTKLPDLFTAYISNMLMVRAEICDKVFPKSVPQVEFLPIFVEGVRWTL